MNWIKITDQPPPQGVVVETKIANPDRNYEDLQLISGLWWHKDRSMYVYYTPTHWRRKK